GRRFCGVLPGDGGLMRLDRRFALSALGLLMATSASLAQDGRRTSPGTRPAASPASTRPATTRPSATTTAPTRKLPYTAPRPSFPGTGDAIAAGVAAASLGQVASLGKEAAEANAGGSRALGTGAPGLGSPQAFTNNAVVGQPGLQRGLPIGFGPLPAQNLF